MIRDKKRVRVSRESKSRVLWHVRLRRDSSYIVVLEAMISGSLRFYKSVASGESCVRERAQSPSYVYDDDDDDDDERIERGSHP